MTATAGMDDNPALPISERIALAEQRMRDYENKAMYLDAEQQRQLIQSLKKTASVPTNDSEFRAHWARAIEDVEKSNQSERTSFEAIWAGRLAEQAERAEALLEATLQRHRDRSHELAQVMERTMKIPKWSTTLLDLRRKQYLLAKTKRYVEAEATKRRAQQMEDDERQVMIKAIEKDMKMRVASIRKRHELEMAVSQEKMALERKCLLEAKQQMLERLETQCRRKIDDVRRRARLAAKRRDQQLLSGTK